MRYLTQANRYVLLHSDKLSPYRQEFLESERAVYGGIQISKCTEDKWLVEKFPRWLANRLQQDFLEQVRRLLILMIKRR
ncbi:hypothetical protein V6Z11_A12G127100 [Gossypium hirsutum]